MKLLLATKDVSFFSPIFGEGFLQKETVYFAFNKFARDMASSDAGIILDERPPVPSLARAALREISTKCRILLIHSGGYGDTINVGILLKCFSEKYGASFDVCCHRDKHDFLLEPMGFKGAWFPFPPPAELIKTYDYVLSDLSAMAADPMDLLRRSPIQVLGEALGVSIRDHGIRYRIPADCLARMSLPATGRIRIGLNFDAMTLVKSFPDDLQRPLVSKLLSLNLELHFLGRKGLSSEVAEYDGIHNHVNQTNIPEMAALLYQMDLVLGVDSFVTHLSGLLGKRTLVLLATTGDDYFHHYAAVSALPSRLHCAPCFHVSNTCPLGHARCDAFYHESMRTDLLVSRVIREISSMYGRKHG